MRKIIMGFLLTIAAVTSVNAETYSIGTGSQDGIYYPLGGALAKVWANNINDFDMKVEVTAASLENTIKVANEDMLTGIAQGNVVLDGYQGEGKFPAKMPVRVLFALYPNLIHLVVPADSSIQHLDDLAGKNVSLGAPGSGTLVTASSLLSAQGLDPQSDISAQYLNYSETTNAIANGQIDAGFIVGGQGVGTMTQLALTKDIRVISLTKEELAAFIKENPAYSSYEVPADVYKGVEAFNTASVWNVLVVNSELDEELAYEMTKVAFENLPELRQTVKAADTTTIANATSLAGVPLHEGAQRYIDSQK